MAIHVQDPEADRMLRDFAKRRNVGLTAAIKLAVAEADRADERRAESLRERIEPLLQQVRAARARNKVKVTPEEIRQFIDDGWDNL